jgi:hypothetical protein
VRDWRRKEYTDMIELKPGMKKDEKLRRNDWTLRKREIRKKNKELNREWENGLKKTKERDWEKDLNIEWLKKLEKREIKRNYTKTERRT